MNAVRSRKHRDSLATRIGLKTALYSSVLLVVLLLIVVSGALVFMTTRMHEETRGIRVGLASIRAAQAVKVYVLEFSRAKSLHTLTQKSKYADRAAEAEASIHDRFAMLKRLLSTAEDRAQLELVTRKVLAFLESRKTLDTGAPLEGTIEQTVSPLDNALKTVDVLINSISSQGDQAIQSSDKMDRISNQVAALTLLLALVILATIVSGAIKHLYAPLIHIHAAIFNFSQGAKSSRAPEEGLRDLQLIAHQFNLLADETIEFNKKRVQFLAGTAHDFRNPLAAVKTAVLLLKKHFDKLTAMQRGSILDLLERQVIRLENMTSSFLEAIRIESGEFTLNLKNVDLVSIVKDIVQLWSTSTEKHKFVIRTPQDSMHLECDPMRMEQVITNLISNAIKYSPQGGTIEVELRTFEDQATISVKDQGLGISPQDIDKIFEPFHRTLSAQQLIPGVGIGLWITKRLVEAHHGKILVESAMGQGSVFKIQIPISTARLNAA